MLGWVCWGLLLGVRCWGGYVEGWVRWVFGNGVSVRDGWVVGGILKWNFKVGGGGKRRDLKSKYITWKRRDGDFQSRGRAEPPHSPGRRGRSPPCPAPFPTPMKTGIQCRKKTGENIPNHKAVVNKEKMSTKEVTSKAIGSSTNRTCVKIIQTAFWDSQQKTEFIWAADIFHWKCQPDKNPIFIYRGTLWLWCSLYCDKVRLVPWGNKVQIGKGTYTITLPVGASCNVYLGDKLH